MISSNIPAALGGVLQVALLALLLAVEEVKRTKDRQRDKSFKSVIATAV